MKTSCVHMYICESGVCVYVCVQVCMWMCTAMRMLVKARGHTGVSSYWGVFLLCSLSYFFSKTAFFWRIWSSLISLDWLASNPYDMPVCTPQLGLNRKAIVSDFGIGARDLGLWHHAWTVVTLPVLSILLVLWVQSKIMLVLSAIFLTSI